ncbi:hypothetical protein GCM10022226_56780 [Sphaerisporangium flaviroseum]|uniref:Uncharacterized protein n=1 Tax=Sphaerisporangium flaviroseum TaxID=509199 RepID=A0ABP7IWP0_9ACTN
MTGTCSETGAWSAAGVGPQHDDFAVALASVWPAGFGPQHELFAAAGAACFSAAGLGLQHELFVSVFAAGTGSLWEADQNS